jgi:RimJ/RimL family protein N-acetyltransferase
MDGGCGLQVLSLWRRRTILTTDPREDHHDAWARAGQAMPAAVYLLIESKGDGLLGMVSLQNISWRNRSCNLDVYVGVKQKRNGTVAALAVYRALEYAFDELNLHRINAFIYGFNKPSWRIFEKAGAVREMTLEKHVMREGALYDAYGYGLLMEEFDDVRRRHGTQRRGYRCRP